MLNNSGVIKVEGIAPVNILVNPQHQFSVGVVVSKNCTGYKTINGKKILKAGTPLTGSLDARTTAFTNAETTSTKIGATSSETPEDVKVDKSNAVGVLLHDIDITSKNANGTLLLRGEVNKNRLETSVKSLITTEVVNALPNIVFIAC